MTFEMETGTYEVEVDLILDDGHHVKRVVMPESAEDVSVTFDVRIRDMARFRLLIHELETLVSDMRVGASPFSERAEHLLERFLNGGDDEGET